MEYNTVHLPRLIQFYELSCFEVTQYWWYRPQNIIMIQIDWYPRFLHLQANKILWHFHDFFMTKLWEFMTMIHIFFYFFVSKMNLLSPLPKNKKYRQFKQNSMTFSSRTFLSNFPIPRLFQVFHDYGNHGYCSRSFKILNLTASHPIFWQLIAQPINMGSIYPIW